MEIDLLWWIHHCIHIFQTYLFKHILNPRFSTCQGLVICIHVIISEYCHFFPDEITSIILVHMLCINYNSHKYTCYICYGSRYFETYRLKPILTIKSSKLEYNYTGHSEIKYCNWISKIVVCEINKLKLWHLFHNIH